MNRRFIDTAAVLPTQPSSHRGSGSSVGIVTDYGLDRPGSNPRDTNKFQSLNVLRMGGDRLWHSDRQKLRLAHLCIGRLIRCIPECNTKRPINMDVKKIPVGTRFSVRPDRPWGPPSLLYNGYRVFPGSKVRPGHAADHSPPSSVAVMEE